MTKTSFDDLCGGKYLTASDVSEDGQVMTVERVEVEKMRDGGHKAVAYFEGEDRGVVLNKTRARFLADAAGSKDYDEMTGVRVKVVQGETEFGAQTVPC